ncbi:hypothetical protein HOM98_03005 [Candidatus Peregrinibacteria bacterium]|nr:hypothetical protein [Candidatus Peregrinibacteria bacterium]
MRVPLVWAEDLWISNDNLALSDTTVVHTQTVRVYATVHNSSDHDILGSVRVINLDTGEQIGTDQAVSALSQNTDTVFVDWTPSAGTYTLSATIYPWDDTFDKPENNNAVLTTTVDYDFDGDGAGNTQDPDDDNDGVDDVNDVFPYDETEWADTDGDGIGDNADEDDDNDGTNDDEDDLPQDENETEDTDGDGVGNNADADDDNDGLTDEEELTGSSGSSSGTSESTSSDEVILSSTNESESTGSSGSSGSGGSSSSSSRPATDPTNPDTDGDGVDDFNDAFPTDETEWADSDGDGIGNNADSNDDNDDLLDVDDEFPENQGPVIEYTQTEEIDPETGETITVFDASASYDPDGDSSKIAYRWFTKDGRLIGEFAELRIGADMLLPSTLQIFDENGEWRTSLLNLKENKMVQVIGMTVGVIIFFTLALLVYLKYTSPAKSKPKTKKKKRATSKRKTSKTSKKS